MNGKENAAGTVTVVVHSPALVLGSLEITQKPGPVGRRLGGTWLKSHLSAFLYWCARHLPFSVTIGVGNSILSLVGWTYWLPGMPVRRGCHYMSTLSQRAGHSHTPAQIRKDYISNAKQMYRAYCLLYRDGWEGVIGDVELSEEQRRRFQDQIDNHGGVMMVVPHNFASAFSGLKFSKEFPILLTSKNSSSIDRTKVALKFFERMDVKVLMVRDASRVQTSRALFRALRSGNVVAATTDSIMGERLGTPARIFGQEVLFPAWAARIACRAGAPILPVYVRCRDGVVSAEVGEPIVTDDADQATQEYVSFYEKNILADPANWAFMIDKKWLRVLKAAVEENA